MARVAGGATWNAAEAAMLASSGMSFQGAKGLTGNLDSFEAAADYLRLLLQAAAATLARLAPPKHAPWRLVAWLVFDFLQLLMFPFATNMSSPFAWDHVGWLRSLASALGVGPFQNSFERGSAAWFAVALALYLTVLALLAYVLVHLHLGREVRQALVARICQRSLSAFAAVLYIPMLSILWGFGVALMRERQVWTSPVAPYGGFLCLVVAASFTGLTALHIVLSFETDPELKWALSGPHPRWELMHHGARTLLVVAFVTFSAKWFLLLVLFACNCGLAYVFIMRLPYYQEGVSLARGLLMAALAWVAFCTGAAEIQSSHDTGASLLLYVATPLVVFAAYLAIINRRKAIAHLSLKDATNPFDIELKVRFFICEMRRQVAREKKDEDDMEEVERAAMVVTTGNSGGSGGGSGAPFDGAEAGMDRARDAEAGARLRVSHSHASRRSASHRSARSASDDDGEFDVEMLSIAANWFVEASQHIQHSPTLHYLWAQFEAYFSKQRIVALFQLSKCEDYSPRWDEVLLISRQRLSLDQNLLTHPDTQVFASYLRCLGLAHEARRWHRETLTAKAQFWAALKEDAVDLGALHTIGLRMNEAAVRAEKCYTDLLASNKNACAERRRYADFLQHAKGDSDAAKAMRAQADAVERQQALGAAGFARAQMYSGSKPEHDIELATDVFDDKSGVVVMGTKERHLGVILHCSEGFAGLFGYIKSEMEGKNMSMIIPAPFAELHDAYVTRYIETGVGPLVNMTRRIMALHHDGTLLPVSIHMHEVPGAAGDSSTAFMAVLKRWHTRDAFIYANSKRFVTYYSANCVSLLPNVEDLRATRRIDEVLPGFSLHDDDVQSPNGWLCEWTTADGKRCTFTVFATELQAEDSSVLMVRISPNELANVAIDLPREKEAGGAGDESVCKEKGGPALRRFGSSAPRADFGSDPDDDGQAAALDDGGPGAVGAKAEDEVGSGLDMIRQIILSRRATSQGALQRVRRVLLVAMGLIVAGMVVGYALSFTWVRSFVAQLEGVSLVHQRRFFQLALTSHVKSVAYAQRGVIAPEEGSEAHALLMATATEWDMVEAQLSSRLATAHADFKLLASQPNLNITERQNGQVSFRLVNLRELVTLLISRSKLLADTAPTRFNEATDDNVFSLVENNYGVVQRVLNESSDLFALQAEHFADKAQLVELATLISCISAALLVLVLALRPAVVQVHASMQRVLALFLDVPRDVVVSLHSGIVKQVELEADDDADALRMSELGRAEGSEEQRKVREGDEEDEEEKEEKEEEEEEEGENEEKKEEKEKDSSKEKKKKKKKEKNKMRQSQKKNQQNTQRAKSSSGEEGNDDRMERGVRPEELNGKEADLKSQRGRHGKTHASARAMSGARKTLQGSQRSITTILLRVMLLVIIITPYFVSALLLARQMRNKAVAAAREVNWAGRRRNYCQDVTYLAREAVISRTNATRDQVQRFVEATRWVQQALLYGDEAAQLEGAAKRISAHDEMMFESACPFTSSAGCETFYHGVLSHGANPALAFFLNTALSVSVAAPATPGTNISASEAEQLSTLRLMSRRWLDEVMVRAEGMLSSYATDAASDFLSLRLVFLIVWSIALVLLYRYIYVPLLTRLERDTLNVRAMLLHIPVATMQQVKSIRSFIRDNAASA